MQLFEAAAKQLISMGAHLELVMSKDTELGMKINGFYKHGSVVLTGFGTEVVTITGRYGVMDTIYCKEHTTVDDIIYEIVLNNLTEWRKYSLDSVFANPDHWAIEKMVEMGLIKAKTVTVYE